LGEQPVLALLHNPEIETKVLLLISRARASVEISQYCFGSRPVVNELVAFVKRGGSLRILLDEGQAKSPSTRYQAEAMRTLSEWRAELRVYRPPGGGFASLHQKTMLVDRAVYVVGSSNMTDNSLHCNVEATIVTRAAEVCEKGLRQFEQIWALASPVSENLLLQSEGATVRRRSQSPDRGRLSTAPAQAEGRVEALSRSFSTLSLGRLPRARGGGRT
jgi:phosphatidylserine/phosphatidylglycerophosphate/cardiolipin synthase-like enzyme